MKKNDIISVDIVDISHDGSGIGKTADGFVVFVPGALKGEKINVLILKVLKNFAYGKISEFISISPCRTEEVCPVFSKCGGCVYMHTTYKNELDIKKQRVKNALLSVAKTDFPVSDTLGGEEWHYRNKMLVPLLLDKDNKVKAGFFRKNSHDVIPMEKCYISNEEFLTITNAITDFCNKYNVMPYNEKTKKGIIRHIYIRRGFHTGEIMAGVVTKTKKLPYKDEFISCLTSLNLNIVSIIQNINEKDTNVILGNKTETLFGKSYITDYMLGNKFNISCEAFYQVNTPMAEKLYETAISYLDENDKTVFDLYCGAGTITLSIAKKAHKVIGIESCEPAVQNAKDNARENNMQNAEFICGEAETKIFELIEKGITPDAVMLDPPRSGCDIKLLKALLDLKPKKIIYISCNPSTMARDIKELSEAYTLKSVQPVDLFPKTSHVETVVLLSQLKPDDVIQVELNSEDLALTSTEAKATYEEIKTFVKRVFGFKVSSLYIAQVKRKYGIEVGQNYNISKKGSRVPICPQEKEDAIVEALRHFKMIK